VGRLAVLVPVTREPLRRGGRSVGGSWPWPAPSRSPLLPARSADPAAAPHRHPPVPSPAPRCPESSPAVVLQTRSTRLGEAVVAEITAG